MRWDKDSTKPVEDYQHTLFTVPTKYTVLINTNSKRVFPACCGTLIAKYAVNSLLIFVLITAMYLVGVTNCLL